MSSTWIFDPQYGYYKVRFGGSAKVLQSYFAVAKIVILLCTYSVHCENTHCNNRGKDLSNGHDLFHFK